MTPARSELPSIGHNSMTLDQAKLRLETSGYMLARLETLMLAIRDHRVDRGCLRVLVELVDTMNRETWTSWIGREAIAGRLGMSAKAAGNYLYQLKALGYIVGEKRETPQADNKVLMHYTLSALSPDEIERAISRAVGSIRGEINSVTSMKSARGDGHIPGKSACQDGHSQQKVPARTGTLPPKVPVGTGTARGDGHFAPKSARGDGQELPARTGTPKEPINHCTDKTFEQPTINSVGIGAQTPTSCVETNLFGSTTKSGTGLATKNTITTTCASGERGVGREIVAPPPDAKPKIVRGTRLPDNWRLSKSMGEWALANFEVTATDIRAQAEKFANHWHAKAGGNAVKINWDKTWQNWCGSDFTKWKRRSGTISDSHAPGLPLAAPSGAYRGIVGNLADRPVTLIGDGDEMAAMKESLTRKSGGKP